MKSWLPDPILLEVGRRFNVRLFLIVLAACIVGLFGVIPYSLSLQANTLSKMVLPIPLPLLIALQIGQNVVLFALCAGLGLLLADRIGLGLPFMEGALNKNPIWGKLPRIALIAAVLGIVGALLIIALDVLAFAPQLQAAISSGPTTPATNPPPAWQGFLASFYGGITEEVMMRLFVLTLLAWLGRFISRTADNRPTVVVMWVANILAAVVFGLGHLPATQAAGIALTPFVVTRAIILNGLIGVVAGWLYSRWGLESAIICHFSADIVLHVLLPLVG